MIRVANIIEDGRIAGPQLRIFSVAKELKERGIETVVVHPRQQAEAFSARLDQGNIAHAALSIRRLSKSPRAVLTYILCLPWELMCLAAFFRRGEFDIVHCSGGFWQIKGLIAAKLAGVPAIWHMNDTVLPVKLRPLFLFAARHFASRLIFAGNRVRNHYLAGASLGIPSVEIQAPVDCRKFDPASVSVDPRIFGEISVITVANLNPLKGLEYFIEMAAIAARHTPQISFHVIGPTFSSQSTYLARIKDQITRHGLTNIHFHGPSDNIAALLKAADIYVCSSIAEASPTSVWEAMAMAKALVSTDVGDVARFTANGEGGLIVPIKDPDAMAAAVQRFASDKNLRQACGQWARRVALENLDLGICVECHYRLYLGVRNGDEVGGPVCD